MAQADSNQIVIELSLSDKDVTKVFERVSKSADKATKDSAASYKEMEKRQSSLNTAIQKTGYGLLALADTGVGRVLTDFGMGLTAVAVSATILTRDLGSAAVAVGQTVRILSATPKLLTNVASVILKPTRNLFHLSSSLALTSTAFFAFGKALEGTESRAGKMASSISKTLAIAFIGLSAAVTIAIYAVGRFAYSTGNKLVGAISEAVDKFSSFQRQSVLFGQFVENFDRVSRGAVGSTVTWTNKVNALSSELNLSRTSLQKAGGEIISVGSKLGLTQDQLEQLTEVTANYAKINGKDVFDSSVAFVGALAGNAQAVQAYGVKLNTAANQQYLLKKGIDENFSTLTENQKVQVRFNNLIGQFGAVSGIAAAASGTLAEQNKKLEVNTENFAAAFGRGAAVIENTNIVSLALNKTVFSMNESIIAAAGFFSALGARILQIGGFLLLLGFKIFAVTKIISVLNTLLASNFAIRIFNSNLGIANTTLQQLANRAAGTTVKLDSFVNLLKASGTIAVNQFSNALRLMSGQKGALTFLNVMTGTFSRLSTMIFGATRAVVAFLLPFGPMILAVAAVGALVYGLVKAFKDIENRTGAFTTLFTKLKESFSSSLTIFSSFGDILTTIKTTISSLITRGFGLLVFGVSKLVSMLAGLVAKNPFGMFSSQVVQAFQETSVSLNNLSEELRVAGFDIGKLEKVAMSSSEAITDAFSEINIEDVFNLRRELADIGKSQLQIIRETANSRLSLITGALQQELISEAVFQDLKNKILLDSQMKRNEILSKDLNDLLERTKNIGLSQTQILTSENERQNEVLRQAYENRLIDEKSYLERRKAINDEYTQNFDRAKFEEEQNEAITGSFKRMVKSIQHYAAGVRVTYQQLSQAVFTGLVNIQVSFFETLGRSLVEGKKAFEDFGATFLGLVGDLAIQIGTLFITAGAAALTSPLAAAIVGNPAALMGKGAALVALGGALKAVGGGGSSAPSGVAKVGTAPNQTDVEDITLPGDEIISERKPDTHVNVAIHGDVYDSEDSGMRIVDLINQAFDKQGISIKRGALA